MRAIVRNGVRLLLWLPLVIASPALGDPHGPARAGRPHAGPLAELRKQVEDNRSQLDAVRATGLETQEHLEELQTTLEDQQEQLDRVTDAVCALYAATNTASPREICPPAPKLVFVTSRAYGAALGGLQGSDAICAEHAREAGLPGDFRAWISTAALGPSDRLAHAADGYVRTDGVAIAQSWEDLTDGVIAAPIDHDEHGDAVASGEVWSNTLPDGTPVSADFTCSSFTSDTGVMAYVGATDRVDRHWSVSHGQPCDQLARLYCFQQ